MRDKELPFDLELAQKMSISWPASSRFLGGKFRDGPLSQDRTLSYSGMPEVFDKKGTLRTKYRWIKEGVESTRNYRPQITKVSNSGVVRPRRSCAIQIPEPKENRQWLDVDNPIFTPLETCVYTPGKFPNWRKPNKWPWKWPCDPTWIPADVQQCQLCPKPICDCIRTRFCQSVPEIMSMGLTSDGARARVPYEVGDFIGELVGELTPVGTYKDGWAAELARDDYIEDGHFVACNIYPRHAGNWTRKINHSCNANTEFMTLPISGHWRIVLRVTRIIKAGHQITVDYGDEYWIKNKLERCLCGTANCINDRMGRSKGTTGRP